MRCHIVTWGSSQVWTGEYILHVRLEGQVKWALKGLITLISIIDQNLVHVLADTECSRQSHGGCAISVIMIWYIETLLHLNFVDPLHDVYTCQLFDALIIKHLQSDKCSSIFCSERQISIFSVSAYLNLLLLTGCNHLLITFILKCFNSEHLSLLGKITA